MELVIISTPIGNLKDITKRAIEELASCDVLLVEDPHVSLKLLNHFGIKKTLISYQKFNEDKVCEKAKELFEKYQKIGLISDAGTPAICDPGSKIVKEARALGVKITACVGACALAGAVSLSGEDNSDFVFLGFFPRESKEQKELLNKIYFGFYNHYVFYESPKRILKTLKLFDENFVKELRVFNDLTKLHEKQYVGSLNEVIESLQTNPNFEMGEYVVSINVMPQKQQLNTFSIEGELVQLLVKGISVKEAIEVLSKKGHNKNDLKKIAIKLKEIFNKWN